MTNLQHRRVGRESCWKGRQGYGAFDSEALPPVGELGTPEFFGHRLQISMTRATVEDRTADLGQTLQTGCFLVGGSSFHGVSGLCMNSLAHGLPGGTQPRVREDGRCRPGSLALGVRQLLVIRTPWLALSVVSSLDRPQAQ